MTKKKLKNKSPDSLDSVVNNSSLVKETSITPGTMLGPTDYVHKNMARLLVWCDKISPELMKMVTGIQTATYSNAEAKRVGKQLQEDISLAYDNAVPILYQIVKELLVYLGTNPRKTDKLFYEVKSNLKCECGKTQKQRHRNVDTDDLLQTNTNYLVFAAEPLEMKCKKCKTAPKTNSAVLNILQGRKRGSYESKNLIKIIQLRLKRGGKVLEKAFNTARNSDDFLAIRLYTAQGADIFESEEICRKLCEYIRDRGFGNYVEKPEDKYFQNPKTPLGRLYDPLETKIENAVTNPLLQGLSKLKFPRVQLAKENKKESEIIRYGQNAGVQVEFTDLLETKFIVENKEYIEQNHQLIGMNCTVELDLFSYTDGDGKLQRVLRLDQQEHVRAIEEYNEITSASCEFQILPYSMYLVMEKDEFLSTQKYSEKQELTKKAVMNPKILKRNKANGSNTAPFDNNLPLDETIQMTVTREEMLRVLSKVADNIGLPEYNAINSMNPSGWNEKYTIISAKTKKAVRE